jgi:CMP-N,N'-diacetyllegionaminic acid synthase
MDDLVLGGNETLCLIIARGGSKGLPNKNLLDLMGKPLIAWPIIYALKSPRITDVVVSTDSEEIAAVARKFGAKVPFIRPGNLSDDLATTESVLQHGIQHMEKFENKIYQYCVFLTATDIFRPVGLIEEGLDILQNDVTLDSFFIGQKTTKNYWEEDSSGKWIRVRGWMSEYGSRQGRKFIVREDTGLGCVTRAEFWRNGRRIGDKVHIKVIDDSFTSIDIHSYEDLALANFALNFRTSLSGGTID